MKECKIGEIFELDGVKMVCLPGDEGTCMYCALSDWTRKVCAEMACMGIEREDGNAVYFHPLDMKMVQTQ